MYGDEVTHRIAPYHNIFSRTIQFRENGNKSPPPKKNKNKTSKDLHVVRRVKREVSCDLQQLYFYYSNKLLKETGNCSVSVRIKEKSFQNKELK